MLSSAPQPPAMSSWSDSYRPPRNKIPPSNKMLLTNKMPASSRGSARSVYSDFGLAMNRPVNPGVVDVDDVVSGFDAQALRRMFREELDSAFGRFSSGMRGTASSRGPSPEGTSQSAMAGKGTVVTEQSLLPATWRPAEPLTEFPIASGSPPVVKHSAFSSRMGDDEFADEISVDQTLRDDTMVTHRGSDHEHWTKLMAYIPTPMHRVIKWAREVEEPPRTGRLAEFVCGDRFETACTGVIVINTVVTLISTNAECSAAHTEETVPPIFSSLGTVFVIAYTCELSFKLVVHRLYFFINANRMWNIFDTLLVSVGLYDLISGWMYGEADGINVAYLRTLRLLKMARVLRVFRLIRSLAVLRLILNSLMGSLASLFWSIVMMVLIFFMFGLVFVQNSTNYLLETNDGTDLETQEFEDLIYCFGSVESAILTLFMATTGGDDWSKFFHILEPMGASVCSVYLFFVAFSQIALMNILTGIFVENAMKLAEPDREALLSALEKTHAKDLRELENIVHGMDKDGDGTIDDEEFYRGVHAHGSSLRSYLGAIGIHEEDAKRFFKMLKVAGLGKPVSCDSFVSACIKLRGPAQSIDVQGLACELKIMHKRLFDVGKGLKMLRENSQWDV